MRARTYWLAILMISVLLAGCGSSAPTEQAAADVSASPPAATREATATARPASPTTEPTATAAPTATAESTATVAPTATVEPAPTVVANAPTNIPAVASDVSDTPHLGENVAPTANVQPVAAVKPAQPVRIRIPAIKLDYKPISVGLDKNRVPVVPKHDIGWYNLSAMPSQGENIVFWGHVLRFKATPKIPAPFARVKELKPGAEIIITTANNQNARYRVTRAVQVTPDQVKYILPVGKEQVTLVSCIGDNVIANGSLTKKYRLVTIAEPIR